VFCFIFLTTDKGFTHEDDGYDGEDQDGLPLLFGSEGLEVPGAGFRDVGFFLFEIEEIL
jgi:hypothetical protein